MKVLTDIEKGYLSGLIDGEGSISLYRDKRSGIKRGWQPYFRLAISTVTPELLDHVQEIVGSDLKLVEKKSQRVYHKQAYSLAYRHGIIRWLFPQLSFAVEEKERKRKITLEVLKLLGKKHRTKREEKELTDLCKKFGHVAKLDKAVAFEAID